MGYGGPSDSPDRRDDRGRGRDRDRGDRNGEGGGGGGYRGGWGGGEGGGGPRRDRDNNNGFTDPTLERRRLRRLELQVIVRGGLSNVCSVARLSRARVCAYVCMSASVGVSVYSSPYSHCVCAQT